ncbi:potassium channel subfamily K member 4 isoform X2 [Silurus meridionalis]|uniref:potassium channel subfamily K member 4 isoform X2 n=1 Tax=Silurus meridionalis TaxID=175797 RepID=UPI001EEB7ACD|nr:potassium channel subfamily K member 4 isoform X2 [Silurus meridionalis]
MRCSTLVTILAAVLLYLVIGALVFGWLEASKEKEAYEKLLDSQVAFLKNHNCVHERSLSEFTQVYLYAQVVINAINAGVDARSFSNFTSRWDVGSAFFFCGTIITTIGFGNLSPKTEGGQLFCIFYALVGIPMFGILLAGVGDHLGTMLRRAVAKLEALFPKKESHNSVRIISAVFSILIGCLIFIALPTVVFQKVEGWTFLEAGYFVVITLTTVGFGDYVAENRKKGIPLYKLLVWLWIVFGLAYFASILTMIGNWLRMLSKKTRAEMEELRAHATDWTQNIQNMSMDFRIPVPLDLNDPFQLQRRRRRKRRRGAHHRHPRLAVDRLPHGVFPDANSIRENGHLFVNLPGSRYNSASDTRLYSSHEKRPGQGARPISHSDLRSDSKPGYCSGSTSRSVSGSDSRSETPLESCSQSDWSSQESGSGPDPERIQASENDIPVVLIGSCASLPPPAPPSPPGPSLLDFFGENLAYIDESSDTLSDRIKVSGAGSNRPRRLKKRSMRRQLPSMSPLGLQRACSSDFHPPSYPPTPPPSKD